MRRLDGETGENYLYKGVTPDEKGAERRALINGIAEDLTGTAPSTISSKYQEFWDINPDNLLTGFAQDTSLAGSEYIKNITTGNNLTILQKYSTLTVGEKYKNICNIAGYIYFLSNVKEEMQAILETKSRFLSSNRCNNRTNNRIKNENTYVKIISTTRSEDLLADSVIKRNVYLNERLITVLETGKKIEETFKRVTRAVPELRGRCMP
jgi:hypothetical protein